MIKPSKALVALGLFAWFVSLAPPPAWSQDKTAAAKRNETAETRDGRHVTGTLTSGPGGAFRFVTDKREELSLDRVAEIAIDGPAPDTAAGSPPFQVQLGGAGRISGRLISADPGTVRLDIGTERHELKINRAGVSAIVQRPGEVQALRDGFETLDLARWSQGGSPSLVKTPHLVGEFALQVPAGGSSLTTRLSEALVSGRLELAYHDDGVHAAGQRWFVDMTFRKGNSDLTTIRVIPGWTEETLAVETPGGPALNVQPLARKPGWHRLYVRFDAARTAISVDGDELAHGHGFGGPLIEVRIATETLGATQPPPRLAAIVDDLRVIRFAEPSGRFEVEPSQDEVRLISGDQVFGTFLGADADRVGLRLDGRDIRPSWSEVSGVYFRRVATPSTAIDGQWVRVSWRTAAGNDARDQDRIEAALVALDETSLTLNAPYVGEFKIARDRVRKISILNRTLRQVIDPSGHHLGDRLNADLDPPQAEIAPVKVEFDLAKVSPGAAFLVLDVVKVIAIEGGGEFSEMVKKGQLRTKLTLNGQSLDDLNLHVTPQEDTPQRVRLAIPKGALRVGKNTLQFDQTESDDARRLRDNLGILGMAIEYDTSGAATP